MQDSALQQNVSSPLILATTKSLHLEQRHVHLQQPRTAANHTTHEALQNQPTKVDHPPGPLIWAAAKSPSLSSGIRIRSSHAQQLDTRHTKRCRAN
jgi:hypothetical protein